MTLAELVEKVEGMPPGSMVPRDWLLEELGRASGEPAGVDSWVDIYRAAEITRETIPTLRARAVRWRGAPNPEIRVTKNRPDKERSPWLFAEADCWAYAHARSQCGPAPEPAAHEDPDDEDEIASRLIERATANL